MSLRVIEPGLQTLVVDAGRPHNRSLGVPLGGAADRLSWMLGNALVGNPLDAAALEICLLGPTLTATCELGISVVGAAFEMFRNNEPVSCNRSMQLHRGDELRIAGAKSWARAYLCVHDGFREPIILGSQSSFEPIKRGQELLWSAAFFGRRMQATGQSAFGRLPDPRPTGFSWSGSSDRLSRCRQRAIGWDCDCPAIHCRGPSANLSRSRLRPARSKW
jgi:hypothetical protein